MASSTSHTLIRRLALLTSGFDAAAQAYVIRQDAFENPPQLNYAPHPYSVCVAFVAHVALQICWLQKLYHPWNSPEDSEEGTFVNEDKLPISQGLHGDVQPPWLYPPIQQNPEPARWEFAPLFILGNLCQSGWALAWIHENYLLCRLFLTISAVTQLYAIFSVLHGCKNRGFPQRNILSHLVAKFRAGLAMLLLWKTWGIIDMTPAPSLTQQLNNLSFFLIYAMASGPDPTMGLFLVAVLFSLALGPHQDNGWRQTFSWTGCIVLLVVLVDWAVASRSTRSATTPVEDEDRSQHDYEKDID
ncbi:hypothetical protein CC1G_02815 [Coprinopsis cinerea okayama7|uniref:Uncharacterized protein n=1 Tax=Coprinopsis cinerea (strain Okayama-7 / 130 / ATCC MYA-4618 / FGSC 9003) TaxID=240176 RepID=A8N046_COPC7|nr:hypothetical protein CC1G_02815 [Coprinopsis cinerea okayama7\|eukprot:XP_001828234.1 hypothetical protein CC1G_02815 [Coprinopsis cinerea okayama7\